MGLFLARIFAFASCLAGYWLVRAKIISAVTWYCYLLYAVRSCLVWDLLGLAMSCQIDDLKARIWMLWLVVGLRLIAMVRRSRVEILKEQKEKIEEQLKQALTVENAKNRKEETRDKILLGVMFQGLIAEGAISTQVFEGAMEKYLKSDKDRERCDTYFERYCPKSDRV